MADTDIPIFQMRQSRLKEVTCLWHVAVVRLEPQLLAYFPPCTPQPPSHHSRACVKIPGWVAGVKTNQTPSPTRFLPEAESLVGKVKYPQGNHWRMMTRQSGRGCRQQRVV